MHRGALWASGAAQAAQFVRIILVWLCGFHELRAAMWRCAKQNGFEPSITLAAMLRQGGNLESLRKDRRLVLDVVGPVAERPRPAHVDAVRLQSRQ